MRGGSPEAWLAVWRFLTGVHESTPANSTTLPRSVATAAAVIGKIYRGQRGTPVLARQAWGGAPSLLQLQGV